MKNRIFALLLAMLMLLSLAACGSSEPAVEDTAEDTAAEDTTAEDTAEDVSGPAGIVVVDQTGREIELSEPATRIVVLTPADCEILYAIGAGDTLVGRGEYCDYPAEVLDVPAVESGSNINVEQILALEPDVVIMSTMGQTEEQIAQMENAGIKIVASDADDIEGTYACIEMIGALMGKDAEAAAIVDSMKAVFDTVSANAEANAGKTIYFEVSPLEYGLWTAGADTFMNEVAEMMGLTNCFADVTGWGEISEEQVLERNPDYIVTITMYFGEGPLPEEEIAARVGWENVSAVQNGKILCMPNNELSRPGPRLADGAQLLSDFVGAAA